MAAPKRAASKGRATTKTPAKPAAPAEPRNAGRVVRETVRDDADGILTSAGEPRAVTRSVASTRGQYVYCVIKASEALKFGATREEISESIAIAIGVNAAAIVDQTDIAAESMDLKLY